MRHTALLSVVIAILIALAPSASAKPASPSTRAELRVEIQPAAVRLGGRATIGVSGIRVGSLQARPVGATDTKGRQLPWRPLGLDGGDWVGTLPAPALHGVYPVQLRTGPGEPAFDSGRSLRVLEPGTRSRPSFEEAADVASWWVSAVAGGTLVALKEWPRPAFDRRDVRLHRLFVVAYTLPGHTEVSDRLGMFVTAFRDGDGARWKLLEATLQP